MVSAVSLICEGRESPKLVFLSWILPPIIVLNVALLFWTWKTSKSFEESQRSRTESQTQLQSMYKGLRNFGRFSSIQCILWILLLPMVVMTIRGDDDSKTPITAFTLFYVFHEMFAIYACWKLSESYNNVSMAGYADTINVDQHFDIFQQEKTSELIWYLMDSILRVVLNLVPVVFLPIKIIEMFESNQHISIQASALWLICSAIFLINLVNFKVTLKIYQDLQTFEIKMILVSSKFLNSICHCNEMDVQSVHRSSLNEQKHDELGSLDIQMHPISHEEVHEEEPVYNHVSIL